MSSLYERPARLESVGRHSVSGDGTSCAHCSREASTPTSHNAVPWPCKAIREAREAHEAARTPTEDDRAEVEDEDE